MTWKSSSRPARERLVEQLNNCVKSRQGTLHPITRRVWETTREPAPLICLNPVALFTILLCKNKSFWGLRRNALLSGAKLWWPR
jgi:hypothetical protein